MRLGKIILAVILVLSATGYSAIAGAVEKYKIDDDKYAALYKFFDETRPLPDMSKALLPPDVYQYYSHDIGKTKALQAELLGFKAPDLVGKIAPEITPGKYSYQDKGNKPGLKALIPPILYDYFFTKGGPPLANCFPEFELIPTRQIYNSLPALEATKKNLGKPKQDAQGYFDWKTWEAGIPFPQPSGSNRIKAMQVLYNWLYRSVGADNLMVATAFINFDKNFKPLSNTFGWSYMFYTAGRVTDPPFGFYDKRAKDLGEFSTTVGYYLKPRDAYGNAAMIVTKMGLNEANAMFAYSGALRRVRKMTGTDSQDTSTGSNTIMDDAAGFNRKMSPTIFPYEYKLLEEREYLMPTYYVPGDKISMSTKDYAFRGFKMERRPVYVVELIQKDPSYVYGRSVIYIDKETFEIYINASYDHKGRLWRVYWATYSFQPQLGIRWLFASPSIDFLAMQSSAGFASMPVPIKLTRDNMSIPSLSRIGK